MAIKCIRCGHENPSTNVYCGKCGNGLANKCRRCWSPNLPNDKHCSSCGIELKRATFGLPKNDAKQWIEKFYAFEWKRQVQEIDRHLLNRITPKFSSKNEVVIVRSVIKRNSWMVGVTGSGHDVYSTKHDQDAGSLLITSWRLILLDFINNWSQSYFYEHINSVSLGIGEKNKLPIFNLDFGRQGEVKIARSKMTELINNINILERLLLGNYAIDQDLQRILINNKLVEQIQYQQKENNFVLSFFESIIAARMQLD